MNSECGNKSLLIDYLYGECGPAERQAFERHLASCAECRREVDDLGGMRVTLQAWAPPEAALGFRVVRDEPARPEPLRMRARWTAVPAWAQLAAAVLVLAVGAAIANLDVRFGSGGVTVRTGWQQQQGPGSEAWRTELAALERNLRKEISPRQVPAPGGVTPVTIDTSAAPADVARGLSADEANELARRFQTLIAQSERRQQQSFESMLATRLVQFARDVDTQRRADLMRIQNGMGQMDTRTTSEVAQLREMQRYLMRVANIQEIK